MKLDKVIAVRTNKTVYRDGHLAIKVFDSDYSKADVLNEALNQARVEETALNVPRLHEVCTVDGKWAIVSDFIPGKTLARLMEENPDRRDEYMDLFVDLQLKMHAQTCPLLNKLKDKMNRKINETGLDATTRYELHARLQGMPTHKKLCHGDFDPKNIILRDDGEASSGTGPTPRRATPAPTRPAPTCCSGSRATSTERRATSTCSAKRATRPSSTCRSGFPSWPPARA